MSELDKCTRAMARDFLLTLAEHVNSARSTTLVVLSVEPVEQHVAVGGLRELVD